jgi:YidC/Oxa1 family membrane protein insertase
MLGQLFTTVLIQPLFNLLVAAYVFVPGHNIGVAIILVTLVIKLLLYPLAQQSIRAQRAMVLLQPKIEAVKKQHKDDKERQAKEMMRLYKEEKINPLSSCLPLLIQLPFLIAVYHVFIVGLQASSFDLLYSFVPNPGTISTIFIPGVDLAKPSIVLALLAGAAQFVQAKMMPQRRPAKRGAGSKDEDMAAMMNKQLLYIMPVITVVIGMGLPGGLSLYWFAMTLLTVLQQWWMFRGPKNPSGPIEISATTDSSSSTPTALPPATA